MTFDEYNIKLENVMHSLSSNPNGEIMLKIGEDALVMIRQRILTSGINAEGAKYAPYSNKPMLSGCKNFIQAADCEKLVGSKDKRRNLKWATIQRNGKNYRLFYIPGGYKQFRELQGRQTGFVDFSFSGDMWRDITIVSNTSEHNAGKVKIGAKREENDEKLAGNTKRRGDILKLSTEEIDDLSKTYELELIQIFSNNGL